MVCRDCAPVGWLSTTPALRAALINWKHYHRFRPSEALATVALGIDEQLANRSRSLIADNLELAGAFCALAGDVRLAPRAGSVALVGLNAPRPPTTATPCPRGGVLLLPGLAWEPMITVCVSASVGQDCSLRRWPPTSAIWKVEAEPMSQRVSNASRISRLAGREGIDMAGWGPAH